MCCLVAYISDLKPQHEQQPFTHPPALQALNDLRRLVRHHSQVLLPAMHAMVIAALPAIDALRSITAKFAMALFQVRRRATAWLAGLRCWWPAFAGASSPLQELCQAIGQSECHVALESWRGVPTAPLPSAEAASDPIGQKC